MIFLVFLLISIIPLLTHPLPPLEDYANHVSRMHGAWRTTGRTPTSSKYYEIDWEMLPNLMMDLDRAAWIAQLVVNVYLASQIFTIDDFQP